uniref:Uncharacterized protein n=1 Tax=Anguilla anguilla TaxID=7936 RepID=A0A0E9QPD7_ANGAN
MTLVKDQKFDQAGRVVEWLTQQRFYGGVLRVHPGYRHSLPGPCFVHDGIT